MWRCLRCPLLYIRRSIKAVPPPPPCEYFIARLRRSVAPSLKGHGARPTLRRGNLRRQEVAPRRSEGSVRVCVSRRRYHRDHRAAGVRLGDRPEPGSQVPLPQGLLDPVRPGQPALPAGHLLHPADGLRRLLRHLLRRIHGPAAARSCKNSSTIRVIPHLESPFHDLYHLIQPVPPHPPIRNTRPFLCNTRIPHLF